MNDHLRRRPRLEPLEAMTLLSGASAALGGALPAIIVTPGRQITLAGAAKGTYNEVIRNPDTGSVYDFFGSGQITPLGRVDLIANLHSPGNIANGRSRASLVLWNPHGSLTLALVGPVQNGNTPVPDTFNFTITNATGTYRGDHGTGYMVLTLTPKATVTARASHSIVVHGTFSVSFLTFPPPTSTA